MQNLQVHILPITKSKLICVHLGMSAEVVSKESKRLKLSYAAEDWEKSEETEKSFAKNESASNLTSAQILGTQDSV